MNPWETIEAHRAALATDVLRQRGRLRLQVFGESMLPSLWPGDIVEIEACSPDSLRPGQVVLACRTGRFYLHRWLQSDGSRFVLRGDSMPFADPPYDMAALQGRVVTIVRSGKRRNAGPQFSFADRLLGRIFAYSRTARRLALRHHHWMRAGAGAGAGDSPAQTWLQADC